MSKLATCVLLATACSLLAAVPANGASWDDLLAAAKKEGSVSVIGPVSPAVRRLLTEEFAKDTGLELSYEGMEPNVIATRVEREAAVSKITVDVLIGGSSELRDLYPKGLLAPIKPFLILPEVVDVTKWQDGKLEFTDPEGIYFFRTVSGVYGGMVINTKNTPASAIKRMDDLLKPDMKGKIVSSPVTSGSGSGFAANVLYRLKADIFTRLYKGQEVKFLPNSRSVVEQVARGSYRVGFGVFPHEVEEFKKAGFPLDVVYVEDLPGYVSASTGTLKIIKNSPHPNAAAVFVNWFATRKIQEKYMEVTLDPSRRIDVNPTKVPSYTLVRPGIDYLDQHKYDFYVNYRGALVKQVEQLIGR